MSQTEPSSRYKIRFIDCDPIGHLTNSRYIDYMLNAREDQVEAAYGLNYQQLAQETHCTWVTLQNQIAYLKEVRYNQWVNITSKIIEIREKTAKVEIQMLDENTGRIHALLWTEVIFFDLRTRKSTPHFPYLMEMFQNSKVEIPEKEFSERVKSFLQK